MKSRIAKKFEALGQKNEKALITYVTAGDPELEATGTLILEMEKAGADIIELGIPYSDPLADGKVIQRASQRALGAGANIPSIFQMVKRVREKTEIPLVFLVYYNSVFCYGMEAFLKECSEIGIDGLIIPDLPLEERVELRDAMEKYPIDLIPLVAPTSKNRIKNIVAQGDGFIYCISSKGVTGKGKIDEGNLSSLIDQIRKVSSLPLAIGFGISDADTVKDLRDLADGLIVGSAIVEKIERGIQQGEIEKEVCDFVGSLKESLKNPK